MIGVPLAWSLASGSTVCLLLGSRSRVCLVNRFLVHSSGLLLAEWSSVCRSRVFLAAREFVPPPSLFFHSLLAFSPAWWATCLPCHSLAWSFACLVACLLGQALICLPMICAGVWSFGAWLPPPLLKCALASQPETRRMRAFICPRSGRSPKRCAPSGRRRSTAPDYPGTNNSSNMN